MVLRILKAVLGGVCNTLAVTEMCVVAKHRKPSHSFLADKWLREWSHAWNIGPSLQRMSQIYTN